VTSVYGLLVDDQARCVHWRGPDDVIAIRFPCCDRYYACFDCHEEVETHAAERWGSQTFDRAAVLCGVCRDELTITAYLASEFSCPSCGATFNPGCALHYDLYFDLASKT
jgi:uncharacterized CHY-type Zn-finger protein